MALELPTVVLFGTPFDRGVIHGDRFRLEIAAILKRDLGSLGADSLAIARNRAVRAFEQIRVIAPNVADELAGIAQGAGCAVPDIVLRSGFELLKPISETGCSGIAMQTATGAIAAQNWDGLPSKQGDLALFVHMSCEGFEFAVVASLGSLGFAGMNRHGLGLVNNDLILSATQDGIPSQVVRRLVLGLPDVASARAAIEALPHMGGRCYLLADRTGEIAAVEVSAKSGANFFSPASMYLHTNNALLLATSQEEDTQALFERYPSSSSRLASLKVSMSEGPMDVERAKKALSNEFGAPDAVSKTASAHEPTETAFSIILDCARGDLHLAAGRPSINPYRKFSLPLR